ncbi:YigZ family protein, partial [Liquorilactobacillus ghanensis]
MKKDFLTIAKTAQAELIIKKSNFIGIVAKTSNEPAAQEFIEHIKDSHPKARHHCFAAIIGDKDQIQRASDNGEPTGTAGAPILNVLKKQQLHNVTAVVVRYYGGIKLGTGGLIRAYSNATSAAIEQAGIVQQIKAAIITVSLAYHQFDLLNNYFNRRKIKPFDIKYS